ncbi:hypothetical protein AB0P12_27675 [Streptomyces subrutilus]|uniref:hypothetical protein n=1 Tax=Streptomyces subrutilus TaxID=36818 RepID=UPI003442308E
MNKARLFENGIVSGDVYAHEIDAEPTWRRRKTPLICAACPTPVVSQRTSVGHSPRAALFRLAPDRTHEETCPLNPVEVFHKIVHGAQGVAVIDGDELHLVLPDDLGQSHATAPDTDTGPANPGDRFSLDISTVRPLLPPLINSAIVIARFLQKHGYDPDVVARFKVRRPGAANAVGWGEFCHGPATDDHTRLYARLIGREQPRHPVAVCGRITTAEKDSQDRPVLRLADGPGFTVRIRSEHPSLLAPIPAGAFVLAVGAWKVWPPRNGRPELQLFAEDHWQLAYWTYDDVTGRTSPPTCPPPLSPVRAAGLPQRPPFPAGRQAGLYERGVVPAVKARQHAPHHAFDLVRGVLHRGSTARYPRRSGRRLIRSSPRHSPRSGDGRMSAARTVTPLRWSRAGAFEGG